MIQPCLCEHSIHFHFMDFGRCTWNQPIDGGTVICDCQLYERNPDE